MKRFLFLTIACLFSIWGMAQSDTDTYVEVLYFHGKQRCTTCKAIEKYTKEVVNADLAELVKNGKLRFKENQSVAKIIQFYGILANIVG